MKSSTKMGRSGPARLFAVVSMVLLLANGATFAWAEGVDAIVSRGIELRRQGRDREALVEFQRALKTQKGPRIQAQVALAEQALGLWTDAEKDLLEAMGEANDPWIKKNHAALAKALAVIRSHLGSIEVWGSPAGAEVLVNDVVIGTLPLGQPLRVSGESIVLKVRKEAYVETVRTVRVPATESVREHVELVAVPRTSAAAATPPAPTKVARLRPIEDDATPDSPAPAAAPDGGERDRTGLRPWAWVSAAGALGGVAFGAIETIAALNQKKQWEDHMGPNPDNPSQTIFDCNTVNTPDACKTIQTAYQRNVTLAIIGYSAGAALAIGSAILFVMSSPRADRRSESALACAPDPFNHSLACRLTF